MTMNSEFKRIVLLSLLFTLSLLFHGCSPTTLATQNIPSGTNTQTAVPSAPDSDSPISQPQPRPETVPPVDTALYHLYVSPSGSDLNLGTTPKTALKTLKKAASLVKPGTTVHVLEGTYPGYVTVTKSGTAQYRIRFISEPIGKARLIPVAGEQVSAIFHSRGNYIDIEGFEVDGQSGTILNGILVAGSHSRMIGNLVHHFGTNPDLCSSQGGSALNTHRYNGGTNNDIIGNTVHNIGSPTCRFIQGIYHSTSGLIANNVVYKVGAIGIHLWHDARDIQIINNTVIQSGYGIEVGAGDFYGPVLPADNVVVMNNIVYDNDYGIYEMGLTGPNNKYINNLVFKNKKRDWDLDPGKTHSRTISADPQFVDINNYNLRLKTTSPAIDVGLKDFITLRDRDGVQRSQGLAPDLGAYEAK